MVSRLEETARSSMEILKKAAPLVPVFFCIDNYVGTVKLVGGRSMQPTFNARGKETTDVVVLDRWTARRLAFRRGDVVVLASPHAPEELMTKRVLGLAGDWVRARPDSIHSGEVLQVLILESRDSLDRGSRVGGHVGTGGHDC